MHPGAVNSLCFIQALRGHERKLGCGSLRIWEYESELIGHIEDQVGRPGKEWHGRFSVLSNQYEVR